MRPPEYKQRVVFSVDHHMAELYSSRGDPFWLVRLLGGEVRRNDSSFSYHIILPLPVGQESQTVAQSPPAEPIAKKVGRKVDDIISYFLTPRKRNK